MLPSASPREALLACLPSPPWNLPAFTVESTLSTPCSHSDLSLSRQGAALAHLDSLPLMIWYSKLTALFLFLLEKAALAYLPTALSVALRLLFSFRQAQYIQVFLLKPAPFCKLFAGLPFLFSSPPIRLSLCPLLRLFSYLKPCGRSGRNFLLFPPVLSGYNGSPDSRFSRRTTQLMSWLDGECYLRPLQSLVVSLLLSLVSILAFSRTGGVLSHLNFLTHRFPRFPLRNLCSLVMLAVFSLIYAATDTAFC